jgi:type VI secretion system protein ImpG
MLPPIDRHREYFWKLISHWSLNYLSVATREALVGLIDLYDWTEGDAGRRRNQRRIEGIEAVRWEPKETIYRGSIIRGTEVTLQIRDAYFADEGDLCIFGLVMSTFFAGYATINAFVHLTIQAIPSGKEYQWTPQRGLQPIL